MRIGFDVSQTAETMAGCAIVADQLLRHLVPLSPSDQFIPYPIFGPYRSQLFAAATRPNHPNVVASQFDMDWATLNEGWDTLDDSRSFLADPDVVHSNSFWCPRHITAPVVYTLYDMSPIECPWFHTEANRLICFDGIFDASLHAAHLVAISESSRRAFLKWFPHVDGDRVTVVYPAARPSIVAPVTDEAIARVLQKYALQQDRFWLAVGTIEPRKNYRQLLEAYAALVADRPADTRPLCIVGQAGWLESSLDPLVRQLGIGDRVRCLGFVEDMELAALYRSAFAFLYPSKYEGFGLPVVEAMACGAAVVAMRSTSLPEVVGTSGLLVDPTSTGGFLEAMSALVKEPELRAELRAAALEQAARFSWNRSAASLLDLYRTIAAAHR